MPLTLSPPVYFADGGPNVAFAQPWYRALLRAHAFEIEATLGPVQPVPASADTAWIANLPTPSVLVLPAICGGCVDKDWKAWWVFQEHLRAYRAAGGLVVCLDKAFNLPADGAKARGRNWRGFETDSQLPGLAGQVSLSAEAFRADVDSVELKVWSEWKVRPGASDARGTPIAHVASGDARTPIAWSWGRPGWLHRSCPQYAVDVAVELLGRPLVRDGSGRKVKRATLARARRWRDLLARGAYPTASALARAHGVTPQAVSRAFARLRAQEARDGTQPAADPGSVRATPATRLAAGGADRGSADLGDRSVSAGE